MTVQQATWLARFSHQYLILRLHFSSSYLCAHIITMTCMTHFSYWNTMQGMAWCAEDSCYTYKTTCPFTNTMHVQEYRALLYIELWVEALL